MFVTVNAPTEPVSQLIKVIIVVLLIGVLISLFSGLVFLFKDSNREDSKRTLYALGIRVTLATALVGTIAYGVFSGELRLGSNAPWHDDRHPNTPLESLD